jgi:hypothetical protein
VFDALFCMSVLRNLKSKRRAGLYPFERFEERVLFLDPSFGRADFW